MGAPGEQFPFDIAYALALTNPVWVLVDGAPVRSVEAADYSIAWIDKLEAMAEQWTGWRSQPEKDHVYAQVEEAREVYRRLKAEAGGGRSAWPRAAARTTAREKLSGERVTARQRAAGGRAPRSRPRRRLQA